MINHLLLVNQLLKKYDLIDQHNDVQEIMVYQVTFLQEYIHMTINQLLIHILINYKIDFSLNNILDL